MTASGYEQFTALIADPDSGNRVRLKQACGAVPTFGKVLHAPSLVDALRAVNDGLVKDVVFVSKAFGQEAIASFIKDSKALPKGQDAAYILMLSENDASSSVAQSVIGGADGLLFAPYSVDQLVEITSLAARVRKDRGQAREAAAFRFLLADMMKQIDVVAYAKSCGYEPGATYGAFKQACSVLKALSPQSLEIYHRVAVDAFEAAPLPTNLTERKRYGGASSRVKKKMSERLAAELGATDGTK